MEFSGFKSSWANPDVWMIASVKKDNVAKCYAYVILYIANCIVDSDRTESVLSNEIVKYFDLKAPLI